jgi:hypothetical protein
MDTVVVVLLFASGVFVTVSDDTLLNHSSRRRHSVALNVRCRDFRERLRDVRLRDVRLRDVRLRDVRLGMSKAVDGYI